MTAADFAERMQTSFARGSGHGLLQLGAAEAGTALPPVFGYWRELGSRYMNGSMEVVELVASTPAAIGYSGLGYHELGLVKMLKVAAKPGQPAVEPSVATTLSKQYPIARPLLVYSLGEPTGELKRYIDWIFSEAGQKVVEKSGYVPLAPGTAGTVLAIPFSLALNRLATIALPLALFLLGGFIAAAIVLSTRAAQILGSKDPPVIVIDEIAGFLVANFFNASKPIPLILAFILFRLFDVTKLFPASKLETLPGGTGIVLDDIMAGIYTFIVLRILVVFAFI